MKTPKFKTPGFKTYPATQRQARVVLMGSSGRLKRAASLVLACGWWVLLSSGVALAQYSIDWHTIDGGGGASTGSVYSVSGTIGQPDAGGLMSGGNYSLTGGFWSLLSVVPTPGAPTLTITRTDTNTALVAWLSPSTGWNLQQNASLNTTNWVAPGESVQDNGTNKFIVINPPVGNRFYRLHKP